MPSVNLTGKGMFIHKIKNTENGVAAAIAATAQAAGITHILIKILNGTVLYNMRPIVGQGGYTTWIDDIIQPVVDACHAQSIQVWGWQYVLLQDPTLEAMRAVERTLKFGLDGFVIDAEAECKNQRSKCALYCQELHARTNDRFPIALSSYRFPILHPELAWDKFIAISDAIMPQVYWAQAHNAGQQLQRSINEFRTLAPGKLIIPTGAAYYEHGWTAQPSETLEFLATAKAMGIPAANLWEWWYAREGIAGMWQTVANFDYGSNPPVPPPPETVSVSDFVVNQVYPRMVQNWGYTGPKPEEGGGE